MEEFNVTDIVVLTDTYMRDWAPDERLGDALDEDSRPQCDIGVILGKSVHPSNDQLIIYEVYWFPANKIYRDHGRRLKLLNSNKN